MRKLRNSKVNTTGHKGNTKHPLYNTWKSMITRCYYDSCEWFYLYGGRGIKVCNEWLDFNKFKDSVELKPSSEYQLDRINPDGNYEPGNIRWASPSENSRNTRAHKDGSHKRAYKHPTAGWISMGRRNGKNVYIGAFTTEAEAQAAYKKWEE